ncbi:response regulator [Aliterella atlantica]|uniref:Response regulator receiver protein n=1 Tax=Aliterella atlantica CENA595 TaxID=1618023 RepID=A0A0D8ZQ03_9CYAN|nr:response regulator [Aliterella atlantica]KJH70888.1 response regulator receiver protein [Aliterella atlantica CENA595]
MHDPDNPALQFHRVLVVDDIADNCLLLQSFLEAEGYQVKTAESGSAALSLIETFRPHLVLLDVMMPEMDGLEVARRIRQNANLPFIPILLVTGYDCVNPVEAFSAGALGFILKPINFDALLNHIQHILPPKHSSTLSE